MVIKDLFEALSDKRVEEKILKIVEKKYGISQRFTSEDNRSSAVISDSDSDPESLELNNKLLISEEKLAKKYEELAALKKKYDELLIDNEKLRKENSQISSDLNYFKDNFSDDLEIYELYSDLSEQTKLSLAGIFKDTSNKGLVACGIQEKNISNLWEFAKIEIVNGSNPDQESFVKLFRRFFERFKLAFPMLELYSPELDSVFDVQKHIKHSSSQNMSGGIRQVLLPGYYNKKTNKTIKMAVVVL